MKSLAGDVIAVLGICFAPFFVMTWFVIPFAPYFTAGWFILAAIPAALGMLCSRRSVRAIAFTLVIGFVCIACCSYLLDCQRMQ